MALTNTEVELIDSALKAMISNTFRKMARIVGGAMMDHRIQHINDIPDLYFAQRVRAFILKGEAEVVGNLQCMRQCEIKWK